MDRKLISVVITNYNYARYLPQCINSVIQSDFDLKNLEIIVIDDASTDNSVKVIEQIIAENKVSIRLLVNDTNLQLIRSRNRGIVNAKGDFVFFLDADNYLLPGCLKIHFEMLSGDADLVACYAPVQEFSHTTGEKLGIRSNRAFDYQLLLRGNYIDAMAMFNRQHLVEAGMYNTYLPPDLWEDYELWLRLGKAGRRVAFIPGEPLTCYRVHPQSKLSTASSVSWYHVVSYLQSFHNLKYTYSYNANNELVRKNREIYSQLFVTESESEIIEIEKATREIRFTLKDPVKVPRLRLDPVNDYAEIFIPSVDIKLKGNIQDISPKISSNALIENNGYYLFDTIDPAIYFDFEKETELDEVLVKVEIMKVGEITHPLIIPEMQEQFKAKNLQIQQLTRKTEELTAEIRYLSDRLKYWESASALHLSKLPELKPYNLFNGIRRIKKIILRDILNLEKRPDLRKSEIIKNLKIISESNYFDPDFYFSQNPEVKISGVNPAKHFLIYGGFDGKNPSDKFDSAYYLQNNPDVKMSGMNPLVHYLQYGSREGRKPQPGAIRAGASPNPGSAVPCAALILASGLSERMGSPKALLMWDQNKSFLEKIILEYLDAGCNPVVCTVNKEVLPHFKIPGTLPNVKIIVNPHPEWGRMHSVRLGLQAVKNSPYCLLQNVDNPFITGNTIRRILESASPEAWISPEYQGKGGHPVLLPNTIIDQILQGNHADMTLRKALDSFPKKVVIMEDDCILKNINTPGDYENQPRSA